MGFLVCLTKYGSSWYNGLLLKTNTPNSGKHALIKLFIPQCMWVLIFHKSCVASVASQISDRNTYRNVLFLDGHWCYTCLKESFLRKPFRAQHPHAWEAMVRPTTQNQKGGTETKGDRGGKRGTRTSQSPLLPLHQSGVVITPCTTSTQRLQLPQIKWWWRKLNTLTAKTWFGLDCKLSVLLAITLHAA